MGVQGKSWGAIPGLSKLMIKKKGLTESSKMQKLTNMKTPWNEFKMVNK